MATRRIVRALAAAGALVLTSASADPITPASRALLAALGKAALANDCDRTIALGTRLIDAPDRATLPGKVAAGTFELVSLCHAQREELDRALVFAERGTKLDEASDNLWRHRFQLALWLKRDADAVVTLEAMAHGRGRALNSLAARDVWRLYSHLDTPARSALRRRMLAVATSVYDPDEPYPELDGFRIRYARLLAGEGDRVAARAQAEAIRDPAQLLEASLDRAVRPLLAADPDIRAATERKVAADRLTVLSRPRSVGAVIEAANGLRRLGHPDEALAMLRSVADHIDDRAQFDDYDRVQWWWDALGNANADLGRYDDAVAAFRRGAAIDEGGGPNVSQRINLAAMQARFGRGSEALATLAVFADPKFERSAYGEMEMRLARGCGAIIAGQSAEADVAFVRSHPNDHPEATMDLLVCANDLDGAAAALIAGLADPRRELALRVALSEYTPTPRLPPDPLAPRWKALLARGDVQAALTRAGGLGRFNIQRATL